MLVSPKDENRSEAVRAEKARLFLEQFIEIEAEWISNWLSMENGETFGADMALLTLEKYRWDDGYHFDTAGIEIAGTIVRFTSNDFLTFKSQAARPLGCESLRMAPCQVALHPDLTEASAQERHSSRAP